MTIEIDPEPPYVMIRGILVDVKCPACSKIRPLTVDFESPIVEGWACPGCHLPLDLRLLNARLPSLVNCMWQPEADRDWSIRSWGTILTENVDE